ncbi:MAG: symporter small accessory protein [Bacillota bacterium]
MLGLGSNTIALAYILSVSSSALCVIYGIMNWHKN